MSYGKSLDFGIVACRRSLPEIQRMIDYLEEALVELEEVAGLRSGGGKKSAAKKQVTKKSTAKRPAAKKSGEKKPAAKTVATKSRLTTGRATAKPRLKRA